MEAFHLSATLVPLTVAASPDGTGGSCGWPVPTVTETAPDLADSPEALVALTW